MTWKVVPVIPFLLFSLRRPSHRHKHLQNILDQLKLTVLTTYWRQKNNIVSSKGHQRFPPEDVIKKLNQIGKLSIVFQPCFHTNEQKICACVPIFWTNEKLSLMVAWSSSVSVSCFKVQSSIGHLVCFFLIAQTQQFLERTPGVFMRKPLTVHIYFLIIISLSFFSTVNSFYLPPLIVVFGHMCFLVGPLFCRTKTEATQEEEE